MAEKKMKPALRFQGFTDEWEQKRLLSIATMHARIGWQNLRKSEFLVSGDYYLITGTDFLDGEIDFANCHYVTKDRYDQDVNIQIENGSILITKDGTLGKVAYVNCLDKPATLNAGVFNVLVRDKNIIFEKYLFQYLKAPFLMDYVAQKATGGTIKHLNQNILVDFPVMHPIYAEQVLLGNCLERIDHLITLYQRKQEKLINIKKSMLKKLFPQNGSAYPEIRFSGFTAPWEQRKVGDFTSVLSGSRVHKNEWKAEGVPFYRSSDVVAAFKGNDNEKAYISKALYEELIKSSGKLEKNDILITGGGSIGIPYIVPNNDPLYSKDADLIWIKKSQHHNSEYLYSYFSSPIFRDYISSISHTGTIAHYTIEQVKDTPVIMPSVEEQEIIGHYFTHIGNLITLHQNKLEKLKNLKKSMLQRMFV